MPQRPVLVTGAAGFIGSHLSRALLGGGELVVGIDNFDDFYPRAHKVDNLRETSSDGFLFEEADICHPDSMQDVFQRHTPKIVIHLAALAGVQPSIKAPRRYADVNVTGLVNVLDAARGAGCRDLLFASSSSVYGERKEGAFAETDRVDEPISPYAATKCAGELICHAYAHLFDLSIGCLRFFTVYGPAQRPDLAISKFMTLVAKGDPVQMYGDGTSSRDYTYIDDIVRGVLAAKEVVADSPTHFFRIWNLGGSSPIALSNTIDAIGRVVGRRPRIDQRPSQPGDVRSTAADLTRSEAELGFRPSTPFHEGLERQWTWLKKRL